jgi:DNA polymerase type B, organellar and viral
MAKARVSRWKATNPDKVKDQKSRAADRAYHRPFISIDFEGRTFLGQDEHDKKGNVYPLHRVILCGAGGWQRLYTSTELEAGIGLPTLGKECPSYFLGSEDKKALDPVDIIEWMLGLPGEYNRANGFPHGVNFVSFSFNYDVTQILLPPFFTREKVWEITRKRSWKTKKRVKAPTLVGEYAFDYLKSKWFKIWKLRDPENPYKDKLDKNGNIVYKKNGKPEREIDAIAYICIEDAFGFYQTKFTKAIEPLVKQGYVAKGDYGEIVAMKERRNEFDKLSFEEIKSYCGRELVCLSKALTVLRDGFDKMEIRLRAWTGAGSPAGCLIRKEELKEEHYSPDIVVTDECMSPQQWQAHHAMIGGRIEPVQQGYAMNRDLWLYDIVSAYPNALLLLPSMRDGRWVPHDGEWITHYQADLERMKSINILSMFHVRWKFPTYSRKDGRGIPFNPLPYRTKRKSILFPNEGHAWIMRDELIAAFKWAERFDCVDGITVEEWNEFVPDNDEVPYEFVAELYEMRRVAKSKKEYDIVEKAIKLTLNSLYGKTVQSVGGDEENAPSCCCPYYGAAITANCRSRLIEAALIDPYAVVCFMTDGIVTTRELKGLPRAKEVFEGEPPEGTIMELGDWEFEQMAGGFFLQSGVYCLVHKSGKTKDKTRGADPRNFILKMPLKDLMLNRVLPEWKGLPQWKRNVNYYSLDIEIRNYITAGAAAASDERFKLIGRWCDTKRTIDIHIWE